MVKEWAEEAEAQEKMKKGNQKNRQVIVTWNQKKRKFQGGVTFFTDIVKKLRTEKRPLDLAFRRILLILVKAVLAKMLGGEAKPRL